MSEATGSEPSVIFQLKVNSLARSVLYLLIKIHKLASNDDLTPTDALLFKVRSITSCLDGPTDRIMWFLTIIFIQLLKHIPAHSEVFLVRQHNARPKAHVMESFDFPPFFIETCRMTPPCKSLEFLRNTKRQ